MKIDTHKSPFALAFSAHKAARSFRKFTSLCMNQKPPAPLSWQVTRSAGLALPPVERPSIYVVDDLPRLTELYTGILETIGYSARTFNDRANALNALTTDKQKPALLITDYFGLSMPVNSFIHACRFIYPSLRILMASGFHEREMRFTAERPDCFIQKPFTPDEFQQSVKVALSDGNSVEI